MAVNPDKIQTHAQTQTPTKGRYHPNTTTPLRTLDKALVPHYLTQCLTRIIQDCPPTLPWSSPLRDEVYKGLFAGPTSIAYLFYVLSISSVHKIRELVVCEKGMFEWSKAYLSLGREDEVEKGLDINCGIANEYLAFNALKACVYQDVRYAQRVFDALRHLETEKSFCEWLKGRAGALYLLRFMKSGLPQLAEEIDGVSTRLIDDILPQQPWTWSGGQYLGTVHGEIGILTQIVLTDSSIAPKLEGKLLELLKLQGEDGNWPVIPGKDIGLVQFCHGAPGFVISLLAIHAHFPSLESEIDVAIKKARDCTWEKGVLVTEPNICHGVLGNGLALEGERKEAFLAMGCPETFSEDSWERDTERFGMLWGEAGRAWVWAEIWAEAEDNERSGKGKCALYSDF